MEITISSVRAEQMDKQGLIPDMIGWNLKELVDSITNKVCVETIRSNVLTESVCVMATLHWICTHFLKTLNLLRTYAWCSQCVCEVGRPVTTSVLQSKWKIK